MDPSWFTENIIGMVVDGDNNISSARCCNNKLNQWFNQENWIQYFKLNSTCGVFLSLCLY